MYTILKSNSFDKFQLVFPDNQRFNYLKTSFLMSFAFYFSPLNIVKETIV